MNINIIKTHPDAKTPTYAHDADACFDVYAVENAEINSKLMVPSNAVIRARLGEGK